MALGSPAQDHRNSKTEIGDVTMPTREQWVNLITERKGKVAGWDSHGGTVYGDSATNEHIEGDWFHRSGEDYDKKTLRDKTAREMRKDGWEVKTESNSLGWFIRASRKRAVPKQGERFMGIEGLGLGEFGKKYNKKSRR